MKYTSLNSPSIMDAKLGRALDYFSQKHPKRAQEGQQYLELRMVHTALHWTDKTYCCWLQFKIQQGR